MPYHRNVEYRVSPLGRHWHRWTIHPATPGGGKAKSGRTAAKASAEKAARAAIDRWLERHPADEE